MKARGPIRCVKRGSSIGKARPVKVISAAMPSNGSDAQPQHVERLDDLDRERSHRHRHALHPQFGTGMDAMLHTVADHGEMRVDDVEMRVDPQRGGEEAAAIGGITVEEIAVVEIAVGAGIGNRLRRSGGLGNHPAAEDHQIASFSASILSRASASEQAPRAIDRKFASPRSVRSTKAALNTAVETPCRMPSR